MNKNKSNVRKQVIAEAWIKWEASIKRFIGRYFCRREDIEELAQETFLRAYSATRGRPVYLPKSYLFRVARNIAIRELAKKSNQLTEYLEESRELELEESPSVDSEVAADQQIRLLLEAIAELPPQCRRVFLMRKYQALSHKQIAGKLGISTSAVEKHIAQGVLRCSRFIERREASGSETDAKPKLVNS